MTAREEGKAGDWEEFVPIKVKRMYAKLDDISASLADSNPNKGKVRDIKPLFV